jgi:hypothetical protein
MTTTQQPTPLEAEDSLHRYDSKTKAQDLARVDSIGGAACLDNDEKTRDIAAAETAFVGMTKLQAIRKFWRPSMFCYFCAFGVMMDGSVHSPRSKKPEWGRGPELTEQISSLSSGRCSCQSWLYRSLWDRHESDYGSYCA